MRLEGRWAVTRHPWRREAGGRQEAAGAQAPGAGRVLFLGVGAGFAGVMAS